MFPAPRIQWSAFLPRSPSQVLGSPSFSHARLWRDLQTEPRRWVVVYGTRRGMVRLELRRSPALNGRISGVSSDDLVTCSWLVWGKTAIDLFFIGLETRGVCSGLMGVGCKYVEVLKDILRVERETRDFPNSLQMTSGDAFAVFIWPDRDVFQYAKWSKPSLKVILVSSFIW